jgi:hypothetical protein
MPFSSPCSASKICHPPPANCLFVVAVHKQSQNSRPPPSQHMPSEIIVGVAVGTAVEHSTIPANEHGVPQLGAESHSKQGHLVILRCHSTDPGCLLGGPPHHFDGLQPYQPRASEQAEKEKARACAEYMVLGVLRGRRHYERDKVRSEHRQPEVEDDA